MKSTIHAEAKPSKIQLLFAYQDFLLSPVLSLDGDNNGKIIMFNLGDPILKRKEELKPEGQVCCWFTNLSLDGVAQSLMKQNP